MVEHGVGAELGIDSEILRQITQRFANLIRLFQGVDFTESDEALMRWAEETARKLPGFRPVGEWRDDVAARMGLE